MNGFINGSAKTDAKQFLVFRLHQEEYAIDTSQITSIIEKDMAIARVPDTPDFIKGIINLRGEIVPIMDMRKRFDLPPAEDTENTRIIIIRIDEIVLGLVVDSVSEVLHISDDSIENITNFSNGQTMDYVYGVGKVGDRVITILKLDKLISI